jgi:hypothetical protein
MSSEVNMGQLEEPEKTESRSMLQGLLYKNRSSSGVDGTSYKPVESSDTAAQGVARGHLLLEEGFSDYSLLNSAMSEDNEDDAIGLIGAESYMRFRLLPAINRLNKEIPRYERRHQATQIVILFATMMASVCGVIGLHVWIPSVAALVASVESLSHFDQTSARLVGANAALTSLKNLKLWWQSLSRTEQSLPHYKAQLVQLAEDAIESDVSAWTQGMLRKKRKVEDASEEDEEGGGGGSGGGGDEQSK